MLRKLGFSMLAMLSRYVSQFFLWSSRANDVKMTRHSLRASTDHYECSQNLTFLSKVGNFNVHCTK